MLAPCAGLRPLSSVPSGLGQSVVSECFCLRLGTLRAWPQNVIPCPFPGAQDRAHSTVT